MALDNKALAASLGLGGLAGASSTPPNATPKADASKEPKKNERAVEEAKKNQGKAKQADSGNQASALFAGKSRESVKTRTMTIRVYPEEADRWKAAAEKLGVPVTVFIETVLNDFCDHNKL